MGLALAACGGGGGDDDTPDTSPPPPPMDSGPPPECTTNSDCSDGDPCTEDTCDDDGMCAHDTASKEGELCDDGDACTVGDVCDAVGGCAGAAMDCNDDNQCTTDSCDGGSCVNDPAPLTGMGCDDADACTLDDTCDASGACVGTEMTCDDTNPCTADSCADGSCVFDGAPLAGTECDDSDMCTLNETCDGSGECTSSEALDCDDENQCTADSCVPATGCVNDAAAMESMSCDDGDACSTTEQCVSGECTAQTFVDCADDESCTVDACVSATGACTHTYTVAGMCPRLVGPGDLVVTEVMGDPKTLTDPEGEWFEVLNVSGVDVSLFEAWIYTENRDPTSGLTGRSTFHVADQFVVPAGARMLFMSNGDSATNGGLTADLVYGGGSNPPNFNNSPSRVVRLSLVAKGTYTGSGEPPSSELIDDITFELLRFAVTAEAGQSWQLRTTVVPTTTANDNQVNWCLTPAVVANEYSSTNFGTPGADNVPCS